MITIKNITKNKLIAYLFMFALLTNYSLNYLLIKITNQNYQTFFDFCTNILYFSIIFFSSVMFIKIVTSVNWLKKYNIKIKILLFSLVLLAILIASNYYFTIGSCAISVIILVQLLKEVFKGQDKILKVVFKGEYKILKILCFFIVFFLAISPSIYQNLNNPIFIILYATIVLFLLNIIFESKTNTN